MGIKRIDKTNLLEKTYQIIKEQILGGHFKPGEKLSVLKLSEDLGVSRTPIRDALNRLEIEHLIVTTPKVGTFVANITEKRIIELIDARVMIEIWASRCMLELPKSERDKLLIEIRYLLEKAEKDFSCSSFTDYLEKDYNLKFHKSLLAAMKNEYISDLFLKTMEYHTLAIQSSLITKQMVEDGLKQHVQILEALENEDFDGAVILLRSHLQYSQVQLVNNL